MLFCFTEADIRELLMKIQSPVFLKSVLVFAIKSTEQDTALGSAK